MRVSGEERHEEYRGCGIIYERFERWDVVDGAIGFGYFVTFKTNPAEPVGGFLGAVKEDREEAQRWAYEQIDRIVGGGGEPWEPEVAEMLAAPSS